MTTRLQARIVPMGGSQGVEIPDAVLEESGLERDVILEVEEHRIVIHPASHPVWRESRLNAEIDDLYAELRKLRGRSANEEGLEREIEGRTRRLRDLQAEAADAMERRFLAGRDLSPGRAWKALEKARQILDDEDPTDDDETAEP